MQDFLNLNPEDEINLRELFITLWAYKIFIIGICTLGLVLGGYYVQIADKKYTSEAIFKMNKEKSSGSWLSGNISALTSLAGLDSTLKDSQVSTDMVKGRLFIEKIDAVLNFQEDPYFNTHSANAIDPIWKSFFKRAIGWQESSGNSQEAIWQSIVAEYDENIAIDKTSDGSVKIVVTHANPQRAAKIANTIMNEIISSALIKKDKEQKKELSYLSNTLAKALYDLEVSQSNLKVFALENSALPLEEFTVGSMQLDVLREKLNRTSKLHEAVDELLSLLQNKTTDQTNYITLRKEFPIVDQVEFRRVLGQNEIIGSWSWPETSTVNAVFDTLTERKNRLQSEINSSQINAERSSKALETYAKLEREAKVAEASYTVLIEQVKAQSMVAGYQPEINEIYEYASASINPSTPKPVLILVLGAFSGLFVGSVISLLLAFRSGIFYSKNSLINGAKAAFTASVKSIMPLRNKSLKNINMILAKKPHSLFRNMAVRIHKSAVTQVVITSSRAKLTSNEVAQGLACYMQSETTKVAIIDFSPRAKKLEINSESLSIGSFIVAESATYMSVLQPDSDLETIELISHKKFLENIQSLNSTFDLIFLCADNVDAISLLSALEGQKVFHITLARTKKTKYSTITQLRSLLPIQGLLHD
jgi:uncharacterized protein involved in exopolysaccharide biosynthesis